MTDEELRAVIHDSPDKGFREMYDKYCRYVYTVVFRILNGYGSQKDIDDCVVDVFTDVILRFDITREGSLLAYLGTAAKNKAISIRRAVCSDLKRNVSLEDYASEAADQLNIEADAENSELAAILLDKIDCLGKPDSDIIINKYFFCRNSREIGEILGLSPASVRVRCRRALQKLRQLLEGLDITL